MRRVPRPLLVILAVGAVQALAWACVLPAFQGQDEPPHFAYTQRIFETGRISWNAVEHISRDGPSYSEEVFAAQRWSGTGPLALNVAMRPYGEEIDERRWERVERRLTDESRQTLFFTSALRNPPLYYLYEGIGYAPLEGADLFTRLFVMRLLTIPFMLVAIAGAWLLAGEVFGRRRWLQAVTALVVALQPLLAQVAGVVNPDAAIAAIWAVGLWLAAVIVNRGPTRGRVLGILALLVVAVFTHARAVPVAAPLLVALAARAWPLIARRGRMARVSTGGLVAAGAVAFVGASLWYTLRGDVTATRTREFASYLWQFYLPRLDFMTPVTHSDYGVRDVFVDRVFSGFALLEVNLAPWILDVIAWVTIAGAVLTIAALVLRRHRVRRQLPLLAVFVVAVLALMWTLHLAAWHDLPRFGDPIITGRYLTALLPLAGLSVAAVAAVLPRRVGPAAATVVLGLESLLAISALGTAVVRFYV